MHTLLLINLFNRHISQNPRRHIISNYTIHLSQIGIINQKINSTMELSELLTVILDIARDLVNAEGSSILLTDQKSGDLIFDAVIGEKNELILGEKVPKGAGIAGTVFNTGKPLIVNNVQEDPRHFPGIDRKTSITTHHILCLPMKIKGKLIGVLEVINAIGRKGFNKWDQKLMAYLAEQAAIAISNRMVYDELECRIQELRTLHEISQAASYSVPKEKIFDNIIQAIARTLEVEKASILLYDEAKNKFILTASCGLPESVRDETEIDISRSIAGYVTKSGSPLIVSDIEKEVKFPFERKGGFYKTCSFISAPIRLNNKIIGVLNLTDKKDQKDFTTFDHKVLMTIGTHIAEIYQNLLYRKKLEEQNRISQEINIASEIQKKILPKIPSSIHGHEIAAFNKSAKEVGGDFYDFFKFDNNKYSVLVADVCGKGIPAALFMGTARNIIRAEARINNQPGRLLTISNKYIHEDSEHGMFVTVFFMLVDPHNNLLAYGSAGHNDQLLIRKKTREVIKLNAKGKALGLDNESQYEERVIIYEPGDMALLYTDGVLEYLGDGHIEKGESALIESAMNYIDNPSGLIQLHINHLAKSENDDNFMDDFTILSVKF